VVLPKENHMLLTEAATPDRKSGEAEGSAVRLSGQTKFRSTSHLAALTAVIGLVRILGRGGT